MGWQKRKHDDFTSSDIAETETDECPILGDESQQVALSDLT